MQGPKEKRERLLGERLHLKAWRCGSPKCALVRRPYAPGAHGPKAKRRRNFSDFGRQIREKLKVKLIYGLDERNLNRLFLKSKKSTSSTGQKLVELMERRLDNIVFRLGIAPSRLVARQLVNHGHILVGGKKVKSPAFQVNIGQIVSIRPESSPKSVFKNLKENLKRYEVPEWLLLDKEKLEGKMLDNPKSLDLPFEINLVVESFSK